MATERQVQELVARGVATLVYYHNVPRSRHASVMLKAEIRTVAQEASELGLTSAESGPKFFGPVEAELIARYGVKEGGSTFAEFARAFNNLSGPLPVLFTSHV